MESRKRKVECGMGGRCESERRDDPVWAGAGPGDEIMFLDQTGNGFDRADFRDHDVAWCVDAPVAVCSEEIPAASGLLVGVLAVSLVLCGLRIVAVRRQAANPGPH